MNEQQLKELAWSHGYAFGKYTQQTLLDDELKAQLDNSKRLIQLYQQSYNQGFTAGMADTQRSS